MHPNQRVMDIILIMNANEKLFINALMSRKFIEESKAKELFHDEPRNDIENALPSQKKLDHFGDT